MMTLQNIDENYAAWSSSKLTVFNFKYKQLLIAIFLIDPEEAVTGLSIHNPVAMESACGTPLFTNYTSGFDGCLDYIFFEKSKLSVHQVYVAFHRTVLFVLIISFFYYARLCLCPVLKKWSSMLPCLALFSLQTMSLLSRILNGFNKSFVDVEVLYWSIVKIGFSLCDEWW